MPTWITPKTFALGDYLSFMDLNAAIGHDGDLDWLKANINQIGLASDTGNQTVDSGLRGGRVYGGAQDIPDSTWTLVTWDAQRFGKSQGQDINFLRSERPELIVTPSRPYGKWAGYYMLGAHVAFAPNATGDRGLRISYWSLPFDNTPDTILASQFQGAHAGENSLSVTAFNGEPQGSSDSFQDGNAFAVEVYQSSGDSLALITGVGAYSPEFWFYQMAVEPL